MLRACETVCACKRRRGLIGDVFAGRGTSDPRRRGTRNPHLLPVNFGFSVPAQRGRSPLNTVPKEVYCLQPIFQFIEAPFRQ